MFASTTLAFGAMSVLHSTIAIQVHALHLVDHLPLWAHTSPRMLRMRIATIGGEGWVART